MNPAANPPHYPWQDDPFQWHPYAEIFSMMSESELEELVADIDQNGQLSPIQIYDGMILDGRNRYWALEILNERRHKEGKPLVAMTYGTFAKEVNPRNDALALSFVRSHNLMRRNLTTSQRAALAAEFERHYAEIAKREEAWRKSKQNLERENYPTVVNSQHSPLQNKSAYKAGKDMNVGQQSVSRAKAVMEANPELHQAVKNGEISVNAAYNAIKPTKQKEPEPDPIEETEPDSHIIEISNEEIVLSFVSNLGFLSPAQVQCCLNEIYNSRKSDLMDFLANLRMIEPTLFNEELTNV